MSLIYTFAYVFVPVTVCRLLVYAQPARRICVAVACCAAADPVFRPCWPVFTCLLTYDQKSRDHRRVQTGGAISVHFSSQTLLNKNRQCCDSWRDAELGVRAVSAVGDTTDEDHWVDLLCCSSHCDTAESCLTNDTLITFSSSSNCWRRPSPPVRRPSYHRLRIRDYRLQNSLKFTNFTIFFLCITRS